MSRNLQTRSKRIGAALILYSMWVLLAALWALVAFQLQTMFIYLGILVVQTPAIRPTGWNTGTISGISRCGFLILGALWLGTIMFAEKYLREGIEENRFLVRTGHLLLIIGGTYAFSAGLLYLLG